MSGLIPTIVRLPKSDLKRYKAIAAEEGMSFSELVRDALGTAIAPSAGKGKKKVSFFDITKIAVKGGVRDGAMDHDKYIYKRDW
ncbi:MAG: hypothetical protein AAB599_02185 [Patescibacteria group bacterium]